MPQPDRDTERVHAQTLGRRIRYHRLKAGLTRAQAARAMRAHVTTWRRWELGERVPRPWRLGGIARTLTIPVAQLLTDELVLAEVQISPETLARVKAEGRPAARAAAEHIAGNLEALILAEASRPPVDVSAGARPKRRRTRAEVLAGTKAAAEARRKRAERDGDGRIE